MYSSDPRNINNNFNQYNDQGIQGGYQSQVYPPIQDNLNTTQGYNQPFIGGQHYDINSQVAMGAPQLVINPGQFVFIGIPMRFTPDPLIELQYARSAKIKQKMELFEVLTGCETPNRYHVFIKNAQGQDVYLFKCKEHSSWFCRNCCSSKAREFRMSVKHVSNESEYGGDDYTTKFAEFSRPFKCTCCCFAR